jgi:peptidoglycan/LPS O-acetylase OafA/YrhL
LFDYFSDGKLPHYFLNVLGMIHYQLPGMFLSNPYPDVVNGSLWTVPYELECYLALVVLALFGVMRRPFWLLWIVIVGGFTLLIMSSQNANILMAQTAVPGRALILSFLAGTMFYAAR